MSVKRTDDEAIQNVLTEIIVRIESFFQNSAFPGVRGNGITSRMFAMPVA